MDIDLYLAFVLATVILILIPGPTIMLTVGHSLSYGFKPAMVTLTGAGLAVSTQLIVVALGMASLLAVLAEWFEWIRWAGVAYLVYAGVQQWRAAARDPETDTAAAPSAKARFAQGYLITVTNPKSLIFFAAFFPQFIDVTAPAAPQLAALTISFLFVAVGLTALYAVLAHQVRPLFHGAKRVRIRNRIAGSLLIGAGIGLALARR